MGSARKELADAAFWARLRDEDDRPDPEPTGVKTPCTVCGALCWGDLCRGCLPSGPDDRRVR